MGQIADLFQAGLDFLKTEVPATVTVDGHDYLGTSNMIRSTAELSAGGLEKLPRITFALAVSLFTVPNRPLPVESQGVTWNGLGLRVDEVSRDPTGTLLLLRCKAITK